VPQDSGDIPVNNGIGSSAIEHFSFSRNKKGRGQALPSVNGQRWKKRPAILLVENGNALPAVDAQPAVPAFGRIASVVLFSAVTAGKCTSG